MGTLTLESDLTVSAGSRVAIELNGLLADRLDVGGDLNLSGAEYLDVRAARGPWVIATYGGTMTGTFDYVTPGYVVDYTTAGQVILNSMALAGDYNGDGEVNASDYVVWRKNSNAYSGETAGYSAWS